MLTEPPLRRSVMLLCFGAAGLLLAAEWQVLRLQFMPIPWQSLRISRLEGNLEQSPLATMVRGTRVVIRLTSRQLELYEADELVKRYEIAVGQATWETPIGHFAILEMQRDPLWQHPITKEAVETGPDNPLGSRWIGFAYDDGYHIGIHGTNEEELLGQAVSHGCVRMRDADIQQLFKQLAIGTPVTVRPD